MKLQKQTKYRQIWPAKLKREVARRYEAGEFSLQVGAEIYDLKHRNTVWEMVKWYRKEKAYLEANNLPVPDDKRNGAQGPDDDIDQLSIEELKDQLRKARLEAEGWRTLILNAEEQLQIDIVKKSGAKPSKK
jgi:hypothetical protein